MEMVTTYKVRHRQKVNDVWREAGEPIPEAVLWLRVESWVHTGFIEEEQVTVDELLNRINAVASEQWTADDMIDRYDLRDYLGTGANPHPKVRLHANRKAAEAQPEVKAEPRKAPAKKAAPTEE